MYLRVMVICLFVFGLGVPSSADDQVERFEGEGPIAWRRWRQSEQHIRGVFRIETRSIFDGKDNPAAKQDKKVRFRKEGEWLRLETNDAKKDAVVTLSVGPRYAFRLKRDNEEARNLLAGLEMKSPIVGLEEMRKADPFFMAVEAPHKLWAGELEQIIGDPGFVRKSVKRYNEAGTELVRVDFDYDSKVTKLKMLNGFMILEPRLDWAVREAEYDMTSKWRVRTANTCVMDRQGRPTIARHVTENLAIGKDSSTRTQYIFDEFHHESSPESAFSLTAFGLPEISTAVGQDYSSKVHYWFFAGAAALFASALAIRWRSRRAA